ncbi:MAG: type IV pilin [Halobacteriales archaeon]
MFDFELVDIAGGVILLLLVASVAIIIVATPEVADTTDAPESDWSIDRVNQSYVSITHEGGSPIDRDNLTVIVEEYPRPTEWSGEEDGVVVEGDSTTVQASTDQDIALYWTGVDTVRREVLASEAGS